jgi:hypothetical protein
MRLLKAGNARREWKMEQTAKIIATKTRVHENFMHCLQPLTGAAKAILGTECLLELMGEQCRWKAWASSPDTIVSIERAHCRACHPTQTKLDS